MNPRPDVSEERKPRIIEAAMACFVRKGYTNTTMDDIVAESGLSKGSLYWYFDSKDELFTAAIMTLYEDFRGRLLELGECETATEQLRCGGRSMAEFCRRAQGLFGLFLEFWSQSSLREETGATWAGMLREYAHLIAGLIEEGVRKGEFKPVDAEKLVWAILAAYDGLAAYMLMKPELRLDRVSEVFVEALLSGLLVKGNPDDGTVA
jgi:AcrR family transcriptional regulator